MGCKDTGSQDFELPAAPPPTTITNLSPDNPGFLQLGAQGLDLAGCSCLSLLGFPQPLQEFFLPVLGLAQFSIPRSQCCLSFSQLLRTRIRRTKPSQGADLRDTHSPHLVLTCWRRSFSCCSWMSGAGLLAWRPSVCEREALLSLRVSVRNSH